MKVSLNRELGFPQCLLYKLNRMSLEHITGCMPAHCVLGQAMCNKLRVPCAAGGQHQDRRVSFPPQLLSHCGPAVHL